MEISPSEPSLKNMPLLEEIVSENDLTAVRPIGINLYWNP
jgi:hypothetical protein